MRVKPNKPNPLALSGRIYSLLLYAYPVPFRREYGRLMAQLFRDEARDTLQGSGTAGLIGLWFLTLYDLMKTAFAEHIWEVFHMPIEKLQRWSGPAAAIAGPLWVSLFLIEVEDNLLILALCAYTAVHGRGAGRSLPALARKPASWKHAGLWRGAHRSPAHDGQRARP